MKINKKTRNILSAVLVCLLAVTVIAIIVNVTGSETKNISSSAFSRGALDDNGKYVASDKSLYTSEAFLCQGLTIEADFESQSSFEVFYYREDNSFIGSTGRLTEYYEKGGTYTNAKYARIVLTPTLEEDETISWISISSYANEITVTVSKDQAFEAPLEQALANVRSDYLSGDQGYFALLLTDGPFVVDDLDVEGKTVKKISFPIAGVVDHTKDSIFSVYVVNGDGTSGFKKVQEYEFIIPAYTFDESLGELTLENNEIIDGDELHWYTIDCNISLTEGQTLAFSDTKDTVYWTYRRTFEDGENHYNLYNDALGTPAYLSTLSAYFDVEYLA